QSGSVITHPTISDRIHDPSRAPGTPVVIGVLGEPEPLSLDELTKRSDLVVEARVERLRSYINALDTAVLTDFSIVPLRVLTGRNPSASSKPGAGRLLLSTYGGEVTKDGVTVKAENHGQQALKNGGRYLL